MEIVERGERAAKMLLVWRCKVTSCHVVTRTTYTWWPQRQPLDCLAMPHLLGLTSLAHCRPRSLFLGIVSSKNFTGTSHTRDSRAAHANRFHLASRHYARRTGPSTASHLLAIIDTSFPGDVGCPARAEAGLQALQQRLQQVARFLLLLLEIETTNAPMLLLAGHAPALLAAIPRVQEHWQPPSLANLKLRVGSPAS